MPAKKLKAQNFKANFEISLKKPCTHLTLICPRALLGKRMCLGWLELTCTQDLLIIHKVSTDERNTSYCLFLKTYFSQARLNYDPSYDIKLVKILNFSNLSFVPITKHQARGVNVHRSSIIEEVKLGNIQILWLRLNRSFSGCVLNAVWFKDGENKTKLDKTRKEEK